MRRPRRRLALFALLPMLLFASLAQAGVQLVVRGVDEPLQQAVAASVGLSQYAHREVSEAQVRRLYAQAPAQAKAALEPYGYYDADVAAQLQAVGKDWKVTLDVRPGEPVKVTAVDVQLDAAALALPSIRRARSAIERMRGKRLDDASYDAARDALSATLTANGFLDAKLVTHRVEVNTAQRSAAIKLAWQAGRRYRYGTVHFEGSQFSEGFLDRYLPFKSGDYFDQDQLLQLQQALNGADYFAVVNVLPQVDEKADGKVDIKVELAPAKQTIYTGGPFIGTDTGFGVRGGVERRWVNRRGHKWKNELVLAQRLKTLSTLYSVPMPGDNQRSFNYGANFRDADTSTSQSRTLELVANETRLWHDWTRTVGLHALSGTFTVGKRGDEPDSTPGIEHGSSTLVFAEASLSRKQADNFDFVHNGWSLNFAARSTAGGLLSSASFSQLTADAKWIHAFGAKQRNRLILRGSAGHTWTDDFAALPPQLRFFAGGDQSVRGYGYQSIGPENSYGRVLGGTSLLVASAEVEHYFTRNWGIATFLDAGNAFDGTDYRPKLGTGIGVRWRSPVGMIRVDLGTPIHDSQRHGVVLHLVIGPDL
ncbi:autotransporter assembly complex family protein [Rhodanobacter sp. Si-c]|uniref:Translocation and assembly module subunit TamA n=1 Tax=Rhodanobacter lycopersici TaxID=3162487 RepID=A0ABV3QFG3_9GAMM